VLPYSDTIYIHWECDEDIEEIIKTVKKEGKKIGVALCMDTTIDEAQVVFDKVDSVLMLTIQEPGRSGQVFDFDGLERIGKLNSNSFRGQIKVCVDGGINDKVVRLLQVEDVVSGSSVLSHQNPRKQILNLQSGGYYE
jgi:pentose-5-phosphate-3-epimerase